MKRENGRNARDLRPITIEKSYLHNAHGSARVCWGGTRVVCSAMYAVGIPPFLEGTGKGWLTAEYAMLPASTRQRKPRESKRPDGRSTEISRLIGRSLRCVTALEALSGFTVTVDCDVLDADGGTRSASITGAYVALCECFESMREEQLIDSLPLKDGLAAVSCGIVSNENLLDLDYSEDSRAIADINVVMSHGGGIIEIQGTGEKRPLLPTELRTLLSFASRGITEIQKIQEEALKE